MQPSSTAYVPTCAAIRCSSRLLDRTMARHTMLFALAVCLPVPAASIIAVYPAPAGTSASPDFNVTVDGQPAFIYFTSRAGMQPVVHGDNVPAMTGRNTSFTGFATDTAATLVVTVGPWVSLPLAVQLYPLRAAALLPTPVVSGHTITVTLDGPRQVCLVVNGVSAAPLCVFADPPETWVPNATTANVIYFGPGTTNAGVISVSAGQTVYLAPGAHVYGRVEFDGRSDECTRSGGGLAVRGRGVLDGHSFPINGSGPSLISLQCTPALLEGVTLLNSPQYQLSADYPYTTVRWVKAIAWGYSTDGFTGGAQTLIEHSFVKVNDDSLKPYGTGTLISDVVLWQMENGCAVMGSWNLNNDVGFVTARTLDVIRHERDYGAYEPDALLCFLHGGTGNLSNYLFDDIRVDMPGWAAVQVFVANNSWAHPVDGILGSIRAAIIVRNFSSSSAFLVGQPVQLQGFGPTSTVSGVTLDTVTFGGHPAAATDVNISGNVAYAQAPAVCAGCSTGIVGSDWTPAQKCSMPTSYCRPVEPLASLT